MTIINLVHHSLCPDLLKPGITVVDLGANCGTFANEIAKRFRCKVYAVEASPAIFNQIAGHELVEKFNLAICADSGPVALNISSNPEATSLNRLANAEYVETMTVQGRTLVEFLKLISISEVNLLKMDIEGAEIEVLNSCPDDFLRAIDQITVEFHEWTGVSSRLEVQKIVNRIRGLGFFVFKQTRQDFSDVLFVSRRRLGSFNYCFTMVCIWIPRVIRYVGRKLQPKFL